MEEDNNTLDALSDESQLNSADAEGTVSNESNQENMTLKEMNELLGKNFKDKATALKSVKDTYSYVGKRKEDIIKEVGGSNSEIANELKSIKDNMFFDKNPDYAPYKGLIAKMGDNPVDVVNSEDFKAIFEKAKGFDENQKLKSVLVSNPRLAQTKDALTKARENISQEERERLVAQAVLGSME